MVELPAETALIIVAAVAAVVAALVLALWLSVRRARADRRRTVVVATRLDLPGAEPGDGDDGVGRLERLAEAAVLRVSDADARADRLAGVLGELPQGVVVCDETGEVAYRNRQAVEMEGADPGAGLVAEAVRAVLGAAATGRRVSRTVEVLGPPRRTLTVSGRPIDDGRRAVGSVAVVDDVSERRRFDLIRRDFLTNVTAEIKSPVGALGLLAATIVDEDDPALTRRLARRLQHDALRVGRLVDDLSELSRLDAAALPDREPVPVHLLVAQAVEEVHSLALHRTISVEAGEAHPGLTVVGDRRQLASALRHLVENAVKFSEEGAAVRVRVTQSGGWVEIAVHDEGPGIPARDLERVFECFYRAERSRSRDVTGTGLGLAIAKHIVLAHGGAVRAESAPGQGATFFFTLPLASAA